jgi:hypothetical protein
VETLFFTLLPAIVVVSFIYFSNKFAELKLNGPFKISIGSVLDSFEDYLKNELPKEIKPDQTALLNIRDEMLALIQQTKYLLTLS